MFVLENGSLWMHTLMLLGIACNEQYVESISLHYFSRECACLNFPPPQEWLHHLIRPTLMHAYGWASRVGMMGGILDGQSVHHWVVAHPGAEQYQLLFNMHHLSCQGPFQCCLSLRLPSLWRAQSSMVDPSVSSSFHSSLALQPLTTWPMSIPDH